MIKLSGIITALTPLHIGNGRSRGTFIPTLEYIPGRTIRGMVGFYLYSYDRELFDKSGIDEEHDISRIGVQFRNAVPFSEEGRTVMAPASLRWCKKCGTLMSAREKGCTHRVDGRECLNEGKKASGFILENSIHDRMLRRPDPVTLTIETKCPITRSGHTSPGSQEDGYELSPYHVQSIQNGAKFSFSILVRDDLADALKEVLDQASRVCGIGGLRSRGYGTIDITVTREEAVSELVESRAAGIADHTPVTLVANAPILIQEGDEAIIGFDHRFIGSVRQNLSVQGYGGDSIRFDAEAQPRVTRGFVRGWSLKHGNTLDPVITCTGAGSCVRMTGDPTALAALEVFGSGEMTGSGYGDMYWFQEEA